MLEQRRSRAEFGFKRLFLIRNVGGGVAVDRVQIGMTGDDKRAVSLGANGGVLQERIVVREGIFGEIRREAGEV